MVMVATVLAEPHHCIPINAVRSASNGHKTLTRFCLPPLGRWILPSLYTAIGLRSPVPRSGPLRCRSPPLDHRMSPANSGEIQAGGPAAELNDESDFDPLVSPDGYVSICGFGSLLSERSARSTFPDLKNFRVAALRGFRRVFAHVAPIFFERGIAVEETGEVSSLSVEPCEREFLIVTVFEISRAEVPAFLEREHEFRFLAVHLEDLNGTPLTSLAVLCARYTDDEYFQDRCKGSSAVFFQHYGKYNINKIWRDDILPCRIYLRHCVLAAKNLGGAAHDNFLDHTFLGDRKTTIRIYLASTGLGIMEEEPPELLKSRYGG